MKKSLLSILGLTAILALTGCNSGSASNGKSSVVLPAEEIKLNAQSKALLVGEKFEIKPLITPLLASDAELVYESSDSSVATVSKNGVVTGKKQGKVTIKVSAKDDSEVFSEMEVNVFQRQTVKNVKNKLSAMGNYQKEHVTAPRKLKTVEVETRTLYCDGKVYHQTFEIATFILSKDDAYFYIGGIDEESKYFDAPEHRSTFAYHFYTDEDYHSFLFHENDNVRNWCYVPTEFYLGTETTRDGVIYAMMGSFFVSGSDIAENNVEYSLNENLLQATTFKIVRDGGYSDDNVFAQYSAVYDDEVASIDEENNLDIPANTPYVETDTIHSHWYKGNVVSYMINFNLAYTVNGHNYVLDVRRDYSFERDDAFSFTLPDRSTYTEVYSAFDL